jgi:5-methylcytosine-specific restriction endonuclease McrA
MTPTPKPIQSYPKQAPVRLKPYALRKLKKAVAKRDNYMCACGSTTILSVHHIIPLARGGSDTMDNMRLECIVCHNDDHGIKVILYG